MGSIKDSFFSVDTWLKVIFILLFWVLLTVVGWVLGAIVFVQLIIVLLTGERNMQLVNFGANLGVYLKQIVDYVCFVEDDKPFPFEDFPSSGSGSNDTGPDLVD